MEQDLQKLVAQIPRENLLKFFSDVMKLAEYAQRSDYDDYELRF